MRSLRETNWKSVHRNFSVLAFTQATPTTIINQRFDAIVVTTDPMRKLILEGLLCLGKAAAKGAFTLGLFVAVKD
jgi:hypothetical protein